MSPSKPRLTAIALAAAFAAGLAAVFSVIALGGASKPEGAPALPSSSSVGEVRTAVFAGGCFWCVESDFEKLEGVVEAVSGYTGGRTENPTYREVASETTGHREAVEIRYDPTKIGYAELVDYFLRHVDPLDAGGQFCDRGESYTTAIFFASADEKDIAERALKAAGEALGAEIVTALLPASRFWVAEDYHQDYYKNNAIKYGYYRTACGRDQRVRALWGATGGAKAH